MSQEGFTSIEWGIASRNEPNSDVASFPVANSDVASGNEANSI